ncbi:NAD(P)-dependent oxidoreductase [Mycetocola tolaasinivorans]|uniref:NAD(P)-dependent oxidoreductase n=1 Tax=Mycetocola tolaasinivorans TaxID=76635 RepID=A0A3L6ZXE8_9MICO|nr:NAD(P)-dependent oxidoreductase [Mycetocola tolaasinivorans]RLP72696.1 NAD(P)-dependent oxidoreductase [Mycetocola tolaasinivorans]
MTRTLHNRTILMSGGSRGIGLAIALRAAADGANIVLLAKTDTPHPALEGTIHTAADEIRAAGGRALPIVGDVRNDADIERAVTSAVAEFGGIDIVLNNASVISLAGSRELSPKRYDLMQDVNTRGTYMLSRAALPALLEAENPHVLSLSPPINLDPKWLGPHTGYTLAKYGMSLATLGLAAEFAERGIAANTLWPRTTIQTAAVSNVLGGAELMRRSRTPEIYADAAYLVLTSDARELTGRSLIVEDVLAEHGITDLERYAPGIDPADLYPDIFL